MIQFTHRNAVVFTLTIFIAAIGYILFVQNILNNLYVTPYTVDEFENQIVLWSSISIIFASILTYILLRAFLYIIKIREKEQVSLKKLERLYSENRRYFDNAAVGFLIVDSKRCVLNVNPMLCSIFGYERDELIGKSTEIFHLDNEHFRRWEKNVLEKAQHEEVIRIRYPMLKKDGTEMIIEVSGAPFDVDHNFHDGAAVWTAVDITRNEGRKNIIEGLNKELENSLNYFRNMIAIAPMPIFVKDEQLRYRECNEAFVKLLDEKKSNIIGKTTAELLHDDSASKIDKYDLKAIDQKVWRYSENINIKGKEYVFDIHKSPIFHDDVFSGIIGITVDATRREEQQLYLNRRVEEELLKNLEQEERHIQDRMSDVKFSVIGKLSAGIVHEINTPMTYIKGNMEMMGYDIEELPDDSVKENLLKDKDRVMEGIIRVERIIMSMREMSQTSKEDLSEINIYETLVTALIIAQNRSKHIVRITLQGDVLNLDVHDKKHFSFKVLGQCQRLEQAWIIIINNALDELEHHGDFESNCFDINCFEEADRVKIVFSDNGSG
ncbi:MAG: PAS domain S-box protein, partial [Campylobacterota bacterium]|nr:PAS domain S-box protein [Campylobacterota bacterium]